jgi:hypothetical protein
MDMLGAPFNRKVNRGWANQLMNCSLKKGIDSIYYRGSITAVVT